VNNASGPGGQPEPPDQTDMTGTYVKVILVEAAILIALFVFGRLYS
jgi:hypothetical protein